jgi:hypothetical protein
MKNISILSVLVLLLSGILFHMKSNDIEMRLPIKLTYALLWVLLVLSIYRHFNKHEKFEVIISNNSDENINDF